MPPPAQSPPLPTAPDGKSPDHGVRDERDVPLERDLFQYIWRHSRRGQIALFALILGVLPIYFASLTVPKWIVNGPIAGEGFEEEGATVPLGRLEVAWGEEPWVVFPGLEAGRVEALLLLTGLFLLLVFANGAVKFFVNLHKGLLGERMLRRLRYDLIDRLLRFPPAKLRKVKAPDVASMVKDEVEPLGGFIGDAFVLPVYQIGLAVTALAFILVQSVLLGVISFAVVLIQMFLIPYLRRPIVQLGRERQLAARAFAGHVSEIVEGIGDIRVHDTTNYERAGITQRLGVIFRIRAALYRRKFFVKFLNNFLSQVTPFLFYGVGGLLVIRGQMDIGQLVAVLAAYRDLPGPIKELINWDQHRNDVQLRYDQVIEELDGGKLLPAARQAPAPGEITSLSGTWQARGAVLEDETGIELLEGLTFTLPLTSHVAVVGPPGGGKEHVAGLLVRQAVPSAGSLSLGDRDLSEYPDHVLGRRLGYAGTDTLLFPASVRENMIYALRHQPVIDQVPLDPAARRAWHAEQREALASGNATFSLHSDWVDYGSLGASGPEDLDRALIDVADDAGFTHDLYELGLRGTPDPARYPGLEAGILRARVRLAARLAEAGQGGLIDFFDPSRFNRHATIRENILFGASRDPALAPEVLARNPEMVALLQHTDLTAPLERIGLAIADALATMFADLPEDHAFFEQFSFVPARQFPDLEALANRVLSLAPEAWKAETGGRIDARAEAWLTVRASAADRDRLRTLAFDYVEERHRLSQIDPGLETRILEGRGRFAEEAPVSLSASLVRFDPERYAPTASLLDNLLLGRIAYGKARAEDSVSTLAREVLEAEGLLPTVLAVGLDFEVGPGGRRLPIAHRQKLGLARALAKRPDCLIVDQGLAVLDQSARAEIVARVLKANRGRGVIWTLVRPDLASAFDHVLLIENGRLTAQGPFEALVSGNDDFRRFLKASGLQVPDQGDRQGLHAGR